MERRSATFRRGGTCHGFTLIVRPSTRWTWSESDPAKEESLAMHIPNSTSLAPPDATKRTRAAPRVVSLVAAAATAAAGTSCSNAPSTRGIEARDPAVGHVAVVSEGPRLPQG